MLISARRAMPLGGPIFALHESAFVLHMNELAEFSHVFLSISLDIPSERPIFVRLPPSLSLGNISCIATCIISWIRNMWMTRVQNDIVRCNVLD
jgi:hypothetical protein